MPAADRETSGDQREPGSGQQEVEIEQRGNSGKTCYPDCVLWAAEADQKQKRADAMRRNVFQKRNTRRETV